MTIEALHSWSISKLQAASMQKAHGGILFALLTTIGNFKLSAHGGPTCFEAWKRLDVNKEILWGVTQALPIEAPTVQFVPELHGGDGVRMGCHECNCVVELSKIKKSWQLGTVTLQCDENTVVLMVVHCSPACANEFREKWQSGGRVECQAEDAPADAKEPPEVYKHEAKMAMSFLHLFDKEWQASVSLSDCQDLRRYFELYFGSWQKHKSGKLCRNDQHKKQCAELLTALRQLKNEYRQILFQSSAVFNLPLDDHECK